MSKFAQFSLFFFLMLSISCSQKKAEEVTTDSTSTAPESVQYTLSILINSSAAYTASQSVGLTLTADPLPAEMYITQDTSCEAGGSWETFAASKSWNLSSLNSTNIIHFKVRGTNNESQCVNAQIIHDDQAPTSNSISINSGNSHTGSLNVSLTLASTQASEMYISNTSGCSSGGSWETFATGKSWTLNSTDASNVVYVKFKDLAGNESACISDGIVHDSLLPNLTIDSPNANSYVNSNNQSSFVISGSCGAIGQNVVISGDIARTVACGAGGTWTTTENVSALSDGSFSVTVNHANLAGNPAPAISRTFIKDILAPTASSITINSGSTHTNSSSVTLSLASTGAANMYVTNTAGCAAGGSIEAFSASRAWTLASANATNSVYAKFIDAAGNESACLSSSIIHDSINPTLSFTTPAANTYIYSGNVTAFNVTGTCSENTRSISITGSVTASVSCSAGAWNYSSNYTSISEGTVTLNISHTDLAGNSTSQSRSFIKDTVAPTSTSITLNSAADFTTSLSVTATLSATDAADMYVTEDSTCASGGNYESYATSKSWDLAQEEGYVYLYVKYRDTAQNESACLLDSIVFDATSPVWNELPIHGNAMNSTTSSPLVIYEESASDGESGIQKYQYAIGTGKTGSAQTNILGWTDVSGGTFSASALTLNTGSTYYINMRVLDFAGNEAYVSSSGWIVDNVPPTLTLSSHADNQFISESDIKMMGSCESPYVVNFSYPAGMTGDSSVSCTSNTFIAYASFSGGSGNRAYSISTTDGSSNTTTLNLNFNYQTPIEIAGTVNAITQLNDGSAVYGGSFQSVTTSREMRLVRLNTDGTKDTGFDVGNGFNGQVFAVAELGDGSIVVGGDFTSYRARPAYRIAKISSSGNLDTGFNPSLGSNGFNGVVRAIAVSGSDIFVGGDFTTYKGAVANRIAKLDTSGTLNTTFNPSPGSNGANNRIRGIAIDGASIYIGGDFTTYKGAVANRVAKIDMSGNLDTAFNPSSGANGVNGVVRALAASIGTVYIGGDFTTYQGSPANRIAKVSSSGALDTTFNPTTGSNGITSSSTYVYAIALSGSDLYLAGSFSKYRGTNANRIARVNATTGALNTTFNPTSGNNGANNTVAGLALLGGNIYFGGYFTTYKTAPAVRIARVNSSGTLDTTFSPATGANGFNNYVNAVFASTSKIYVGGYFGNYRAGTIANNIVKISSAGAVDTTFSPQAGANGTNNVVRALATDGANIFVGGDFTTYRGSSAVRIVKIDSNGTVDSNFNTYTPYGLNSTVRALYYDPAEQMIYAGGDFTSWAGNPCNRIAKIDALYSGLDTTDFNPSSGGNGTNGTVRAITKLGSSIYLGGSFTTYRGAVANRIAKVSLTGTLDTTFNPSSGGNGANNQVYALTNDGTNIFAGGIFTTYRGSNAYRIAKIDTSGVLDTGSFTPSSGANGMNSYVYALDYLSGSVFVGGSFTRYKSNQIANYVTKISTSGVIDSTFSPQTGSNGTSGASPTVYAVSVKTGSMYIGGAFASYRGRAANSNVKVDPASGAQIP